MTKSNAAAPIVTSNAVSFPAGGFDHDDLQKGLDHAANLKTPEGQSAAVDKAFQNAQAEGVVVADPREMADHKFVDTDGPNGTETIQVYVPPKVDAVEEKKGGAEATAPAVVASPAPAPAPVAGSGKE